MKLFVTMKDIFTNLRVFREEVQRLSNLDKPAADRENVTVPFPVDTPGYIRLKISTYEFILRMDHHLSKRAVVLRTYYARFNPKTFPAPRLEYLDKLDLVIAEDRAEFMNAEGLHWVFDTPEATAQTTLEVARQYLLELQKQAEILSEKLDCYMG